MFLTILLILDSRRICRRESGISLNTYYWREVLLRYRRRVCLNKSGHSGSSGWLCTLVRTVSVVRGALGPLWAFPGGTVGKNPPAKAGDASLVPGWGGPLEKEMAAHSRTLAWEIPWQRSLAGCSPRVTETQTRLSNGAHAQGAFRANLSGSHTDVKGTLPVLEDARMEVCRFPGCRIQWFILSEPLSFRPIFCLLDYLKVRHASTLMAYFSCFQQIM